MPTRLVTEEFIKRARKVNGDIKTTPRTLLRYPEAGCNLCWLDKIMYGNQYFTMQAQKVHGTRYNYSEVIYTGDKTKVVVIFCPRLDVVKRRTTFNSVINFLFQ